MSLFILVIGIMAWRWPIASLVVAGVLVEYWWQERKGVGSVPNWVEALVGVGTQYNEKCMRQGCRNKRTGVDNLCDDHSIKSGKAVYGLPKHSPTHRCPIEGCNETVVYSKLMCWAHWAKVPVKVRANVYQSWNGGTPTDDHARHCQTAIDSIQKG